MWYKTWNKRLQPILWWLVIIGLVAALPLAFVRERTETSTNNVEIVFNYRGLQEIADTQPNPQQFIEEHLGKMKEAGIHSMAVFESSLQELWTAGRIEVFSPQEAMMLTQTMLPSNANFTYILFENAETQDKLEPIIRRSFTEDFGVQVSPWSFNDRNGLIIEMGKDDALLRPMDPDPITMQYLKDHGFHLVARLSNKRPFDKNKMDELLGNLSQNFGVTRLIVDGDAVPGLTHEEDDLLQMADKMRKYHVGLATIELLKEPQRGFNKLANMIAYDVVRLHSFTDRDTEKFMQPMLPGDMQKLIRTTADRFVLAVKDRNIRMIYLNAKVGISKDKKQVDHPLEALYESLIGPDGAIERIEKAGFTFGIAEPFKAEYSSFMQIWQKVASILLLIGGVALIALMISYFIPEATLLVFVIGLVGAGGLSLVANTLYSQGLALATSIAAPTVAMIFAIRSFKKSGGLKQRSGLLYAIWLLIQTTAISMIGVVYLVALLNQIRYFLVLDQFRGVSLLHLAPIALTGIYVLLFSEEMSYAQRWKRLKELLSYRISVLWVTLAAIAAGAVLYYLSRTGNEGQVSSLELAFRSFMENTMGVRPRNKEFLLAHPLFILGAYLSVRYKNALYIMLIGVIGQLSMVDTFAHLHTPLDISGLRVVYGLVLGIIISLILVAAWEIVTRSGKRWAAPLFKE